MACEAFSAAQRTQNNFIQLTDSVCIKTINKYKTRDGEDGRNSEAMRRSVPIPSSPPVMFTGERRMCLLSNQGTDFLTDWLHLISHTRTFETLISLEHPPINQGCECSSAHLGYKGNRDCTSACQAWTIKHTLEAGSVDGSKP